MKRLIIIILLSIIYLFSAITIYCRTVDFSKLQDRNGIMYLENETTPFTGTAIREDMIQSGRRFERIIRFVINYKDGRRHGEFTIYHSNNAIDTRGNYKDGSLHGDLYKHRENGDLLSKDVYVNGKKHGQSIKWYPQESRARCSREAPKPQQISHIINYENNKKHGEYVERHTNGALKKTATYRNGQLVGEKKYYDLSGNVLREEHPTTRPSILPNSLPVHRPLWKTKKI